MSRDPTKLRVYTLAKRLVVDVYTATSRFPGFERYGLQTQMRRAAVSVVTNIVEGSARRTTREYLHFLNIATGSAAELVCLVDLAHDLLFLEDTDHAKLSLAYTDLLKSLKKLMSSVETLDRSLAHGP